MTRAYGEWHGNMITVEHTALWKPELLQDDVISFRQLWIPIALWGSVCEDRERKRQELRQETLHAFLQNSNSCHRYKDWLLVDS